LEMAERFVVRAAVFDQRLAERGARGHVLAILDDGLAQLADRLVEIAAPTPRDAKAAIGVGEDPAIAGRLRDRPAERCDRSVVAAELDTREPGTDQRRRIAATDLQRAFVGLVSVLGITRREPRVAERDQRLAVVRLDREQRLERLDRRGDVAAREQATRL